MSDYAQIYRDLTDQGQSDYAVKSALEVVQGLEDIEQRTGLDMQPLVKDIVAFLDESNNPDARKFIIDRYCPIGRAFKVQESTNLPLMECKKALFRSKGDLDSAIAYLQANPRPVGVIY